jgi:hypothetical protein
MPQKLHAANRSNAGETPTRESAIWLSRGCGQLDGVSFGQRKARNAKQSSPSQFSYPGFMSGLFVILTM